MSDSTRIKLNIAENLIENNSVLSDTYVKIYNKSLKENYCIWIRIKRKGKYLMRMMFSMDSKVARFVAWIGRFGINSYRSIGEFLDYANERYQRRCK